MRTFTDPKKLQKYLSDLKHQGKSIGFVPTMGYLHDGHLSLVRDARKSTDIVVVSIFVNPMQFSPSEDLAKYPHDFKRDKKLLIDAKTDVIFYPSRESMYPEGYSTFVIEDSLSRFWCGASRPGHFKGVTTIVLKLFNIVMPDKAFFGQKDIQQALILQKMVADLNLPVSIKIRPIIRETDGLAMSSRNVYLNPSERQQALILKTALDYACSEFLKGVTSAQALHAGMKRLISSASSVRIDYIGCADQYTLEPKETLHSGDRILLAVYIGSTRLIDNCQLP